MYQIVAWTSQAAHKLYPDALRGKRHYYALCKCIGQWRRISVPGMATDRFFAIAVHRNFVCIIFYHPYLYVCISYAIPTMIPCHLKCRMPALAEPASI